MERASTACFTGYRPQKLPWGYNEDAADCIQLKKRLDSAILSAYERGFCTFIAGGALGVDMYASEAVLNLIEGGAQAALVCALPYPTFNSYLTGPLKERFESIMLRCQNTVVCSAAYHPGAMMKRNIYMVDSSSLVIAVYDGRSGGTMNTVEYAARRGVPLELLPPIID